jgi:hypothetical protein
MFCVLPQSAQVMVTASLAGEFAREVPDAEAAGGSRLSLKGTARPSPPLLDRGGLFIAICETIRNGR